MPQTLAIQPSVPQKSPQTPPSGSPGNKEQNHFSPHLEKAISGKKPEQQAAQDKVGKNKPAVAAQNTLIDEESQAIDPPKSGGNHQLSAATEAEFLLDIVNQNPDQTYLPLLIPENVQKRTPSFLAQQQKVTSAVDLLDNSSAVDLLDNTSPAGLFDNSSLAVASVVGHSSQIIGPVTISSELSFKSTETAGMNQMVPIVVEKQDPLSNQLQNIITSANETGTVAIAKEESPAIQISVDRDFYRTLSASLSGKRETVPMPATVQTVEHNQQGLLLAEGDSLTITTGKPMQQVTGIRHDSQQQQYFTTKISNQTLADNKQNFQDNPPGDELSQQTTSSTLPTSPFSATEQTNTFSTILTMTGETTAQPTTESAKPIYLPSGTVVHEQEILQQLTERLQLSGRHMDSRINLKLHPAELGELKIDLTLKEGSIRANIVAQSQHTLEILEKNLPKLKTLLENQGFDIDQISLTVESESVADFNLFDRQLFSNNDYTPTAKKGRREDEAAFTLDDIAFAAPVTNTGVNVKI